MAKYDAQIGERVIIKYPRNHYNHSRYTGKVGEVEQNFGSRLRIKLDFPVSDSYPVISVPRSYVRPTTELPYD